MIPSYLSNLEKTYRMINKTNLGLILVFCIAVNGCGGGSSGPMVASNEDIISGTFIDSPVEGLTYYTQTQEGQTNAAGEFKYLEGELVEFYVGSIFLGATTGKTIITPIDLVGGATDGTHPSVINICRFLQSLDTDGNPENGIQISGATTNAASGKSISFAASVEEFENDDELNDLLQTLNSLGVFTDGSHILVSSEEAQIHFYNTLHGSLPGDISIICAENFNGIETAAPYNILINQKHPILLISPEGDKHYWNGWLPSDWQTISTEETELIGCVEPENEVKIQSCLYSNIYGNILTVDRYSYQRSVKVISAYTGEQLGWDIISGKAPKPCPNSISESYSLYGDNVTFDDSQDFLKGFVEAVSTLSEVEENDPTDYTNVHRIGELVLNPPGLILDMTYGNDPNIVYAIDHTNQALYFIDASKKSIIKSVSLPYANPRTMAYSPIDNLLYILSDSSNVITVVDLFSTIITEIDLPNPVNFSAKITLASSLRRIYVLHSGNLIILDMDTGLILLDTPFPLHKFGQYFVVKETSQKLFTIYMSNMEIYSIENDNFVFEGEVNVGSGSCNVELSPDERHLIAPCGGGNSPSYALYDFDSSDLTNILGEWNIDEYPSLGKWSPDGNILYGVNGRYEYLYIMHSNNYRRIERVPFPNAKDYAVLTPSSSGNFVVGFSYNTYFDNDHKFHFFQVTN